MAQLGIVSLMDYLYKCKYKNRHKCLYMHAQMHVYLCVLVYVHIPSVYIFKYANRILFTLSVEVVIVSHSNNSQIKNLTSNQIVH